MKWIEINKAKPKFNTPYLLFREDGQYSMGVLFSTTKSKDGMEHKFSEYGIEHKPINPTHIALLKKPSEPEE